jgi:mRNA interferase MazF
MDSRPGPGFGEVWLADLDPVVGHEQAGRRPIVIVSADLFNRNDSGLVITVPVTRTQRRNPFHVPINPPNGGLRHRSFVLCEMVRSISRDRLEFRIGRVDGSTMDKIDDRLRVLLGLS